MKRIHEEGEQAYYHSEYVKAFEKWEHGLELAKTSGNKKYISQFLGSIGIVYGNRGQYEKALSYFESALTIKRETGDNRGEDSYLINIGVVLGKMGQYEKALLYFKQALDIQRKTDNHIEEGKNLANIGIVYGHLSQYEKALSYHKQALAIERKNDNRRGEGANLTNIGVVYNNLGQYEKALLHFKPALKIKREIGDRQGEAGDLSNIGLVYTYMGQYEKGLSHYKQALAIARAIGNRQGESEYLSNIGGIYSNMRYYEKALSYFERTLAIKREIRDRRGEGRDLTGIGMLYSNFAQYEKALSYYEQALVIFREIGVQQGEEGVLINIGALYSNLGQYEKALFYYEQALVIARKIGDRRGEGADLSNIGVLYSNQNQYEKSLFYLKRALAIKREIGDRWGEGVDLSNIGAVYWNLCQYEKNLSYCEQALAYCERAFTIMLEIGDRLGMGNNLTNIGILHSDMGRYEKAMESFNESLKICMEVDAPEWLWKTLLGLASVEAKLENVDNAASHYEQALDAIETMREGITEKETKTSFMQDKLYVYDELIELLQNIHKKQLDREYDRKSLDIFERKQGRIFLEEMGKAGARNFAGIPDVVLEKENSLVGKLTALQSNRIKEGSKPEKDRDMKRIRELERQIEEVKAEQQKLQKTIKTKYPDYYALKYPKPIALKDIQKHVLKSGEVMMVYGVMEKVTCLWVISKNDFSIVKLEISESDLHEEIENFRATPNDIVTAVDKKQEIKAIQITIDTLDNMAQNGFSLYNLLFPKSVRHLISGTKNLYIIPTGPLYGLPFESLVTKAPKQNESIHYLLQDYTVNYLSSASLLKILQDAKKQRKKTTRHPLLAFAHPEYPETCKGPRETKSIKKIRTKGYLRLMGKKNCFSKQDELPETEDEAISVAEILNLKNIGDALQTRRNASRSNVLRFNEQNRLDDYSYIVFSAHAILPGEISQINQPAIVLSYPEAEGYLTMADVFGLRLNADLVVLSACNTGRGEHIRGEGIMGLTRAFMYAGTPAVTVTLWSVDATASYEINTRMFRHIKSGKSIADALRQAKLDLIVEAEEDEDMEHMKHPFFWAPFVVFGDGMKILK
ncbi:MAG: tetratricopeptide repeat protein [Desulfobacterales bacterium]|nr:tetratricopeptide repeat protein [Desulfobacterales bacterium]